MLNGSFVGRKYGLQHQQPDCKQPWELEPWRLRHFNCLQRQYWPGLRRLGFVKAAALISLEPRHFTSTTIFTCGRVRTSSLRSGGRSKESSLAACSCAVDRRFCRLWPIISRPGPWQDERSVPMMKGVELGQ